MDMTFFGFSEMYPRKPESIYWQNENVHINLSNFTYRFLQPLFVDQSDACVNSNTPRPSVSFFYEMAFT